MEFMRHEKGWEKHKKVYGCVVAPEDGAEPVKEVQVSQSVSQ